MATVNVGSSPLKLSATEGGTNTYSLGDGGRGFPSTHIIQAVGTGWTGSIVVKARAMRPPGFQGTWNPPFVAIPYARRNLGGTASDDTLVILALTADFVIKVDSSGLELALDYTHTAGSALVYWSVVAGPDA